MYKFSYFRENEKSRILQFISDYPFAFLTGSFKSGKQVATQIPVLLVQRGDDLYAQGHIMRNTDHHKALKENPQALLVFTGPSAYVSASWYTNPQIGSTWNYMSVHIAGDLRFLSDEELVDFMKRMTLHFEKDNVASPTYFENLPGAFLNKMLPAIAGFEIKVTSLENVFKLSQNRDEESYLNIISQLERQGGSAAMVADEMRKRREALFPPGVEWDGSRFES